MTRCTECMYRDVLEEVNADLRNSQMQAVRYWGKQWEDVSARVEAEISELRNQMSGYLREASRRVQLRATIDRDMLVDAFADAVSDCSHLQGGEASE